MKILTANIAYGFAGMDNFVSSVRHQLAIHGWGILAYEFFPPLRGKTAVVSETKRVAYVKAHKNLEMTFDMIKRYQPDVLVLNEVIYELYRDQMEQELKKEGFKSIAWGVSTHYNGTSISTLIATKQPGTAIPCTMPQRPSMGGGAGMAGIRLKERQLSILGMHLTYRSPTLFKRQIKYIVEIAVAEKALGNNIVLAGDWNESESAIFANPEFKTLDVVAGNSPEKLTCPTFFPQRLRKPLDHIFIPSHWKTTRSETIAFGSDHLALLEEVIPE